MTWKTLLRWLFGGPLHLASVEETNAVLEEELLAARKEIRALENTALSAAGVTPLPGVEEVKTKPIQRIRHLSLHQRQRVHEMKTLPKEERTA